MDPNLPLHNGYNIHKQLSFSLNQVPDQDFRGAREGFQRVEVFLEVRKKQTSYEKNFFNSKSLILSVFHSWA